MRRVILVAGLLCLASSAYAQDASDAWRKILKNCASSDEIKKDVLFFGLSNEIGSGSVWRFADDRSLRLLFELADMFPSAETRASIIARGRSAVCSGKATSNWSLKFGLPFASFLTHVPLDVSGALSRAKSVVVSVAGYSIETLKETNWKKAVGTLDKSDPYLADLSAPGSIIAENVVEVSGLKAVFTFDRKLEANVKAQFKDSTIPVSQAQSTSTTPAGSGQDNSPKVPTSAGASNGGSRSAGRGTAPPATGASTTSSTTTTAAAPSANGQAPATKPATDKPIDPCASTPTASPAAGSAGVATLHADVTSENQITVCAAGPFYMLAAYSSVRTVRPVGAGSGSESTFVLEHLSLPGTTIVSLGPKPARRQ